MVMFRCWANGWFRPDCIVGAASAGAKNGFAEVIGPQCRNGNQLALWIAECGQFAAEDASRIDIDCSIQPFWFRHRCVSIDDHPLPAILSGPVVTNWQTIFVRFTRRFSVEREIPDL